MSSTELPCYCYKCKTFVEPESDFTCGTCHDSYIEYIESYPGRGRARRTINLQNFFRMDGNQDGGEVMNFMNQIAGRLFGGDNEDGQQLGDFFVGNDEQLQALAERLFRMNEQSLGSPPADKNFVQGLTEVQYTPDACVEDTCSICLDQFKEEDRIVVLPCHHGFHKDCLDPWLTMHSECPQCRHKLPTN